MKIGKWHITVKDFVWAIVLLSILFCLVIGILCYEKDGAAEILSGASTAVSIVLSIVAILYTMIEGANSTKLNQETIGKLDQLDKQIMEISDRTKEVQEKTRILKDIIGRVDFVVEKIDKQSKTSIIDEETRKEIENLKKYINEDIDD